MKKKFKFILTLSSTALISTLPIVSSVSAETNNKEKDKKPTLDPEFGQFEPAAKKEMEEMMDKVIAEAINFIKSKYQELLENQSGNFKDRIQNLFYFNELLKYFEDHKQYIKKEPERYGFHIVFPYVISKNKKYNYGDIDYNGKVYKEVKIGNQAPLDYSFAIEPKGKKKITQKDQVNGFTKAKFLASIKKYSNELIKKLKSIIFDESDVPQIDKDVKLQKDVYGKLSITLPQGFNSWRDYIYSKIRPRYVDFDLTQNQESEEPKQQEEKPNHPPSIPPLVPGDTNVPGIKDLEEKIQSLPTLAPYTTKDYSTYGSALLKSLFDGGDEIKKSKMFYFNNPINTRYEYKVFGFDSNGENNIANMIVHITDRVNPKLTRSYTLGDVKLNHLADWNALKQNQIKATKETFSKLFSALGIDDKIDYGKIKNQFIQNALFNLVESATKMTLSRKENSFEKIENKKIDENFKNIKSNKNIFYEMTNSTIYNLLSTLSSLKINSSIFWQLLPQAFEAVHDQFQEVIKFNKKYLAQNVKSVNGSVDNIVNLFEMNKKDIFKLNALISSRTFDLFKWYDEYLALTKKIVNTFNIFSNIAINKSITTDKTLKDNFIKSYELAKEILNETEKQNVKVKKNIAIALLTIGVVLLIVSGLAFGWKFKDKNAKYLLIVSLIILAIALGLLTAGSILLAGVKGI
ncbi:MSC_0620 family F1-like ATPase-associated subunit [Mycoplasmopsis lipophila]|uniref:MSC_0620 family F1-like ATPase-associated subunit n=1 Tax=Mycoplasmopsis lipophila TaxID=2117 RepID=UPI00387351B7